MSSIHHLNIQSVYLRMILSGKKTVEGRLAKEKYALFKCGDIIVFRAQEEVLNTRITETKHFLSFKDMLEYYGVQACLPNLSCIKNAIKIYHSFPGYAEGEAKLGVIGFKVSLI